MTIRPLGKLLLLMLVVGLSIGIWRVYKGRGVGPGSASTSTPEATSSGGEVEIQFLLTAAKKDWAAEQIENFNQAHKGKLKIVAKPMPSREALHAILKGQVKPVLWSPGSPIWPTRLAEAYPKGGKGPIVDMGDPTGYRVFLRSPLVFVTTKDRLPFLKPLLSGPDCWPNLRKLSLKQIKPPGGKKFAWSHADPLTSSSGMMTIGLMMLDYQRRHPDLSLESLHTNSAFMNNVVETEKALIYDAQAQKGTSALAKAFFEEPDNYGLITAYESAALEAVPRHPEIAVIYPNPTFFSEHAVSILNGDWVTPEQKAGAQEFLKYLGSAESIKAGVSFRFRPAQPTDSLSLDPELRRLSGNGFQSSVLTADQPSYTALNDTAYQWRLQVAKMPPGDKE